MFKTASIFVLLGAAWIAADGAQARIGSAQASVAADVDSATVWLGFFDLQNGIAKASAANPSLAHSAANMMGIGDNEFASVSAITRSVLAALRNIGAEERGALRVTDPANRDSIARGFASRREASVLGAVRDVQGRVSSASWAALSAYVNGPFRASIHTHRLAK
jgi:hypothetical protein